MMGSLHGTVIATSGQKVLIEVADVGYWVQTGSWQPAGKVRCYLYHYVREEASDLYGFESVSRLELFEKLLSVSGIGPKAALALLSLGSTEQLLQAVQEQNLAFLTAAPGVGSKAAQKLIVELRGKLDLIGSDGPGGTSELMEALQTLGYKPAELREQLAALPEELKGVDVQLRWVLQNLNKRSS